MTQWIYMPRKAFCYLTPYVEVIGKVYASSAKEVWFEKSFGNFFVTYTNGVMTWYSQKERVEELYVSVSKKAIENPLYIQKMYSLFQPQIRELMNVSKMINNINPQKLSDSVLIDLYHQYIALYEKSTIYGEPVPLVTKDFVVEEIKKELGPSFENQKSPLNELISILTTPTQKSFIYQEDEELLAVGGKIQKDTSLATVFKNNSVKEIIEKIKLLKIFQNIQKHQQKYCWIPYDYGVQIWGIEHFITTFKSMVTEKNCAEELKHKKEEYQKIKTKQKELIKKYQLSPKVTELCDYVKLATYMMDYKKELFTKSHYLIIPLINELAARAKTNPILVRMMNHQELEQAVIHKKFISEAELQQRYQLSVCIWDKDGRTSFLEQNKVDQFIKEHIQENPETLTGKKTYGVCASVGRCVGKAKIVKSAMHITKVEKGDILIAPMTSPDYVMGMKKAGAIVTDEGGLTCHAAIISRELKIPCIVGTKNATKMFKDGDLIEVNANHGSVRKLEGENSNNIKLIIFDFSGVCFNEEEPPFLIDFAKKYKLPFKEFESIYLDLLKKAEMDQISGEEVWIPILKKYNLKLDIDEIINEMIDRKVMYQEVMDLTKSLRRKYKTSYFTNYNQKYWEIIAPQFDLKPYFDWGIVSYQVKSRKPAIKGFKVILEHFKVKPEEAIFLDDKESNLIEPAKLGLNTILFKNKKQFINELKKLGVEVE